MTEQSVFGDVMKFAVSTPLQDRVAKLGVCPRCHAKTLDLKHTGGGCDWHQCRKCLTVYAVEPTSGEGA